jgi:hypothetical protein
VFAEETGAPTPNPTQKEEYRQQLRSAKLTQMADPNSPVSVQMTQAAEQKAQAREQFEENKEQVLSQAIEQFVQHIDRVLSHQDTAKEKINNSKGLTEDQKTAALADIDFYVTQLLDLKTQAQNAQTLEELRALKQQVHQLWKNYEGEHYKYIGLHLTGRFQDFLNRLQEISTRFETHLEEVQQNHPELDLTNVYEALDAFNLAIARAQTSIDEASALFNTIGDGTTRETAREIFQQGMEILRAAKKDLHEAHMNLRNAVAEAKQALGTEDHDHTETAQ